jgi:hypothetical protein
VLPLSVKLRALSDAETIPVGDRWYRLRQREASAAEDTDGRADTIGDQASDVVAPPPRPGPKRPGRYPR